MRALMSAACICDDVCRAERETNAWGEMLWSAREMFVLLLNRTTVTCVSPSLHHGDRSDFACKELDRPLCALAEVLGTTRVKFDGRAMSQSTPPIALSACLQLHLSSVSSRARCKASMLRPP